MPHKSDFIKNYVLGLRMVELESPFIVLSENSSPKLYEYIEKLDKVQFVDGYYHTYCGEVKEIINNFINYWMEIMNHSLKEADRLGYFTPWSELTVYMEATISTHLGKQVDFGRMYLPVETVEEKTAYKNVQEQFKVFMNDLYKLKEQLEKFDLRESLQEFLKEHFDTSVKKKNAMFEFTHVFISKHLATKVYEFRASIEEILIRIRINLKKMHEERDSTQRHLLQELYNGNKERLTLSRKERRSSRQLAEVECSIKRIRERIEDHQMDIPITRLNAELTYWEGRLKELLKIEKTLKKLKEEHEDLKRYENLYKTMPSNEFCVAKKECWAHMGERILARRKFIDDKTLEASKALVTFFAVRGLNRIYYYDHVGKYMVDEYGHQIYIFDHGSFKAHLNCLGQYKKVNENEKPYYFDDFGRYIFDGGEKVYQCAPCTSRYKIGEDNILFKTTKDCGHSEKKNPYCRLELKDPTDIELLPSIDPVDIKETLPKEVVTYLWDIFGGILTKSLNAVELSKSKNPIHALAHEIIRNKYRRTQKEIEDAVKEADEYRAKVYQDREQKAIAATKAWKAKQVKRRKPEESDDTNERQVFLAKMTEYQRICDDANENR